jgi:hypothetical protein
MLVIGFRITRMTSSYSPELSHIFEDLLFIDSHVQRFQGTRYVYLLMEATVSPLPSPGHHGDLNILSHILTGRSWEQQVQPVERPRLLWVSGAMALRVVGSEAIWLCHVITCPGELTLFGGATYPESPGKHALCFQNQLLGKSLTSCRF